MERTLRIIDEALQAVGEHVAAALRRRRESRLVSAAQQARLGRGRRHGPARVRRGRDDLEQLPGHALERRAGEDGGHASTRPGSRRLAPSDLANAQQQVDVATFMQWVDAYARGETELVTFYRERFRPEFKPAFDAWIATKPLKTKGAPLTPFAMPQYRLAAKAEADRLDQTRRGARRAGATRHPAGVQLRPRRRPLRGRALLRRDEHEAHRRAACARRCSWSATSSSSAPSIWIATFPVSVAV